MELNTNTAFNKPTEETYKRIKALLKANGYKYRRSLASALEEMEFSKEGMPDITLCGWHGTGKRGTNRWYGDVKCCLSLFVDSTEVWAHNGTYPHTLDYYEKCLEVMENLLRTKIQ